ncbi:hypothetical protein ACN47E_001875 [Coniothyrium glycines]
MSSPNKAPRTPNSDDRVHGGENTLPKSEVHFAFGPQGWYWIRCGTNWRSVRSKLSPWSEIGICDPEWMAFKHENGFFIGGQNEDGDGRVVHSWNNSYLVKAEDIDAYVGGRDAYQRLHDWTGQRVGQDADKVKEISITIGPNGSYFAQYGTSQITNAMPKDLKKAIEESTSTPATIALGIKGSWVVLFKDGSRSWSLRNAYASLASSDHLSDSSNRPVFVALSPFIEDNYFLVKEDGACSYSVFFADKEEGETLHKITDNYMRMRAKRDGSSFSHSMRLNGVDKEIRISPTSGAEETATQCMMARLRSRQKAMRHGDIAFAGVVTGGTGVLARAVGLPTGRAIALGTASGVGATLSYLFHWN